MIFVKYLLGWRIIDLPTGHKEIIDDNCLQPHTVWDELFWIVI